jgi:putative ABC transport system permease protein
MLKKIFKHSFRTLNKQKGYLLINTIGLSIGIACSLIIALFIIHELSYDQFNEKRDRIFRLIRSGTTNGKEVNIAFTCPPAGPAILDEIPEAEDYTRIHTMGTVVKYQDKNFVEDDFIEADSSFFNIFSIPLLRGDKKTALKATHQLVLSESAAKKIFGNADPINKTLQVGNNKVLYSVSGIMADVPETSHFRANMIGSLVSNASQNSNNWGNISLYTYVLLKPHTEIKKVNAKMQDFYIKHHRELFKNGIGISLEEFFAKGNKRGYYLMPLKDIHLNTAISQGMKPASNPKYLFIFGSIAILIILIAAINFMNLSTAQASKRAKEVGIRKVSGSSKGKLVWQFLTESIFFSFLSMTFAVIIAENVLPYFNNLLGIHLQLSFFNHWFTVPALVVLSVVIGLFAGSYPAFFLSSFNPANVLKGKVSNSIKNGRLRATLVVLQFSISIVLIVGTIIMVRQIQFMLHKDLGFNKEQLLVISGAETIGNHVKTFKNSIAKIPGVIKVAASSDVPGHGVSGSSYTVEGRSGIFYNFVESYVDDDFFDTYGIKLSAGRGFNESFANEDVCVVNESAIKGLNLTKPFTTRLVGGKSKQTIVGVVKNFHFESLQKEIGPYLFRFKGEQRNYGYITIRLSANAATSTIKEIEKIWKVYASDNSFQFFFVDQDFARKYQGEKQNAQLSTLFSILAIIIASLGLFGLVSFATEQRTKEIGVRKTLGASIISIFYLISKEFILLLSIATLIAWPMIFYVANNWLQNYHYRISIRPFDFLTGFLITVVIALLTISYRTIKSTRTNPVEALKYE